MTFENGTIEHYLALGIVGLGGVVLCGTGHVSEGVSLFTLILGYAFGVKKVQKLDKKR